MDKKYIQSENMFTLFNVSFLITFNIFFGIFVWMPSDLSPNIAIGFISLIFILIEIYRVIKRNKLFAKGELERRNLNQGSKDARR